ncbi:MAG: ribokinase [Oligoflexia bacterium]|nr:ribokinase [Oligoflexia bacterium]
MTLQDVNAKPVQSVVVVGSYVQDLAFGTEEFPLPGQTIIGQFRMGAGGKGFNQAVACQRQGIPTRFIGAVGDDLFGRAAAEFAEREGLACSLQRTIGNSSGAASIVVNSQGENMIVVALGANAALGGDIIDEHRQEIAQAEVLIVQAECAIAPVMKALELAKQSKTATILNPAPINKEITRELLSCADILTPNESEFAFLLNALFDSPIDDVLALDDQAFHALCRKLGVETVVVTLGKEGSFVSWPQGFERVPAVKITPVDSTGAGDAFNGGLAAGLIYHPGDFLMAVRYATAVAALSTMAAGTAQAMPTREAVCRILSENCA